MTASNGTLLRHSVDVGCVDEEVNKEQVCCQGNMPATGVLFYNGVQLTSYDISDRKQTHCIFI